MMPEDGTDQLKSFDAIFFGAVGTPDVPDHITPCVLQADQIIIQQEKKRAEKEEEIRYMAFHDPLTGLANRARFSECLAASIESAARDVESGALMFIDLDRFKSVNDTLGHHVGDLLLKEAALRISSTMRENDLLFRMGGYEFTVILSSVQTYDKAAFLSEQVIDAVSAAIEIEGHNINIGATIGIAFFSGNNETPDTLLKNADSAMYSAKKRGRGDAAVYEQKAD